MKIARQIFSMLFGTPSVPEKSEEKLNLPAVRVQILEEERRNAESALALIREERDNYRRQIAVLSQREVQYPLVQFQSSLAQGVCSVPGTKRHFEFFREENRFCIIVPWDDAEGVNPKLLVPSFLEIDSTQQVTSTIDNYGSPNQGARPYGRVIIYKIPIRGWDDSVIVLDDIDQQGVFGLDGKAIERSRPFTCAGLNVQGFFRREDAKDGWWCNCYFFFEEIGNRKAPIRSMLPPGLLYDNSSRTEERRLVEGPGPKLVHLRIPIYKPEPPSLPPPKKFKAIASKS